MDNLNDSIKIVVRRFVSLSPHVRMKIAARLLRWLDENQDAGVMEKHCASCCCLRQQSLLEQFWDEVEAAHGDGLYPANPFADEKPRLVYAA